MLVAFQNQGFLKCDAFFSPEKLHCDLKQFNDFFLFSLLLFLSLDKEVS